MDVLKFFAGLFKKARPSSAGVSDVQESSADKPSIENEPISSQQPAKIRDSAGINKKRPRRARKQRQGKRRLRRRAA